MAKRKKKTRATANYQHKKKAFLAAFAKCGTITKASDAAGVERHAHSRWIEADAEYAKAFDAAYEQAADYLEEEARRRAHDGTLRMKFHQGQPIMDPRDPSGQTPYMEHEYSDTLLIFLLKGARPKKFKDNLDLTSGGRALFMPITLDGDKVAAK